MSSFNPIHKTNTIPIRFKSIPIFKTFHGRSHVDEESVVSVFKPPVNVVLSIDTTTNTTRLFDDFIRPLSLLRKFEIIRKVDIDEGWDFNDGVDANELGKIIDGFRVDDCECCAISRRKSRPFFKVLEKYSYS
ncbi:hypothetical protein G210_2355 [Candida maltosa Xu316]|uniref:Uncharacterized protein n=1 Tax=Candida maltosa (strain Xu316) TaxID=1245528 RepID=M3HIZ1_CANMX|nr:hypothetical protein G210_2355 [Candida maltosa Xu316]